MTADVYQFPLPEQFDRWGRRVLPDVYTGKKTGHTRMSGLKNALEDRFALEAWLKRHTIVGLGMSPDLITAAGAATLDDYGTLKEIAEKAEDRAGANEGRILGTALHSHTDRSDKGEVYDIEEKWVGHISTYQNTLADFHVKTHTEWTERVVVYPDTVPPLAGKFDRLVTLENMDELVVADLKTGRDVTKYGATGIAVQLACYANATHVWNGVDYDPMPKVNKKQALIIHLPARETPAVCTLYTVDIAAGWEAAQLALQVREWRKTKGLTTPYSILETAVKQTPTVVADDDW